MSETPGQSMGRNLRPQRQSTQGLRQNQMPQNQQAQNNVGSVGQDPIALLNNLVQQYVTGFNQQGDVGYNRLQDQINNSLVQRGIFDSESGVDIANRNLTDYTAQQNNSLAQGLVPLYTALSSLAQNAMEADAARQYNSQFAQEQINNQLDFLRRRIPIDSDAYRTAYLLEKSMNKGSQSNPYANAINQMAAGAALSKPLEIESLEDTPKKPWDPSQGPPERGTNTGSWVYNPQTGQWAPPGWASGSSATTVPGNFNPNNTSPRNQQFDIVENP